MTGDFDPILRLLEPSKCLLLVVDKQRWYLDPAVSPFLTEADASAFAAEVDEHDRFVADARSAAVPVAWTTMTEGGDDAPPNVLARWQRRPSEPRLQRSDPGFAFVGCGPAPGESVFDKVYPDAFSVEALQRHARELERSTVVIIGGYAGRCVLASAFGAQSRGFDVVVPRGLAEPHPRHRHEEEVFLAVVDSVVGYTIPPNVIREAWRSHD